MLSTTIARVGYSAVISLLFAFAPMAQAKDVATQQAGVEHARHEMESAKSAYDADVRQVARTKSALEQQKKQLAGEQKKAAQSRKRYLEAKARYGTAQSAMDKAWAKK